MVGKEIFVRFGAVQDNRDPTRRFRSPADRHADRADQRADRYKEPGDRYEKFSDPAHVVILAIRAVSLIRDGRVSSYGSCGRSRLCCTGLKYCRRVPVSTVHAVPWTVSNRRTIRCRVVYRTRIRMSAFCIAV